MDSSIVKLRDWRSKDENSTNDTIVENILMSNQDNSKTTTEPIRIKILTLGSLRVGKSSFVKKYCEPTKFAASYIPTIGVDYGVKSVSRDKVGAGDVVDIKIDFYDLSGELM